MIRVGDRVVYNIPKGGCGNDFLTGYVGTVVFKDSQEAGITVSFDRAIIDSITEVRVFPNITNCFYCKEENLAKVRNETIVEHHENKVRGRRRKYEYLSAVESAKAMRRICDTARERGFSKKDLAKLAGINQSVFSSYVSGRNLLPEVKRDALFFVLGIEVV